MEAIVQLLGVIAAFLVEVTVHAIALAFLLVMAIFSPSYRRRLRERWNMSKSGRIAMVLGIGVYCCFFAIALFVWSSPTRGPHQSEPGRTEYSPEEVKRLRKTKTVKDLVELAEKIKRERDENKQADSAGESIQN